MTLPVNFEQPRRFHERKSNQEAKIIKGEIGQEQPEEQLNAECLVGTVESSELKGKSSSKKAKTDGMVDDCEKELWWKDIHEPIVNIVYIIQQRVRDSELKDQKVEEKSPESNTKFVACQNGTTMIDLVQDQMDGRKKQGLNEEGKREFVSRCYTL
jgi:hypothetical protein